MKIITKLDLTRAIMAYDRALDEDLNSPLVEVRREAYAAKERVQVLLKVIDASCAGNGASFTLTFPSS
jgi:hypothetical protein